MPFELCSSVSAPKARDVVFVLEASFQEDEIKSIIQAMKVKGELPVSLTNSTVDEISKSLTKYFGQVGEMKIAEFTEKAKAIAEAALKVTEKVPISVPEAPAGVAVGGETATARGLLQDFLAGHGTNNIADTMNMEFFLRVPGEVAQGAGKYVRGNADPDMVEEFPAMELKRVYPRDVPRGSEKDPAGPDNAWDDDEGRWPAACEEAGDEDASKVFEDTGRCVALKSSGVWQALGDGAGGYDDTLGNPFGPFAFNSGWDTDEVSRKECEELGLLEEGEEVEQPDIDFADILGLESSHTGMARAGLRVLFGVKPKTDNSGHRLATGAHGLEAYSPDQPRDEHGRFGSGGEIAPNKLQKIHGHSTVSAIRRMAKEGFTKEQIQNVMKSHGIPVSEGTLTKNMRLGITGAEAHAPFTDEQLSDLKNRAGGGVSVWDPPKPEPPSGPKLPPAHKTVLNREDVEKCDQVPHAQAVATLKSRLFIGRSYQDNEKVSETAEGRYKRGLNERAIENSIRVMHPECLRRVLLNTSRIKSIGGQAFDDEYGQPGAHNKYGGFFSSWQKLVVSNGPVESTYAHEFAHAADMRLDGGHDAPKGLDNSMWKYSGSKEWYKAWKTDKENIREYGRQSPLEGFACSVEHAHSYGTSDLKMRAPNMHAFLTKWKILQ